MTILVYGAGGVGSFYGALLARAGQDVRFVARGAQLDAIRAEGIRIRSPLLGDIHVRPVAAAPRAAELGTVDLALVCVKAHHTAAILDDLAGSIGAATVIVPLQNGVESDEVLAGRFGRSRVVPAVVYVGVTLDEPGLVSHVANGLIIIGGRPGFDAARLPGIRDALASTGLPVQISEDIQAERWRKLIWNGSLNPVSAIAQRSARDLVTVPESRALVVGLMREIVALAQAQGFAVSASDVERQLAWTQTAADVRTSMQVDRERGRSMETDALVGVVVRKGRELGVPTPLSEVVLALLIAIEAPGPLPR